MFTVYKITNNINNKHYIGVHKTNNPNDGYMGSGRAIKAAITKYGIDNFSKHILFITENKEEAYNLEKELTVDYYKEDNYNMKLGGVGGFTKENSKKGIIALARISGKASYDQKKGYHAQTKQQLSENGRKGGLKNKGRKKGPLSEETKQKIRESLLKRNKDR